MSNKFHITARGEALPCHATVRACPLGDEADHFPTKAEAVKAYEERNASLVVAPGAKKGFTITSLEYVEVMKRDDNGVPLHGTMRHLPIRSGFETPTEAIDWARDVLPDRTSHINLINEDWVFDEDKMGDSSGDKMQGNWKSLSLINISRERQVLETKDIPAIAKHYLDKGHSIKTIHDARRLVMGSAKVLDGAEYARLLGYVKAATYGRRHDS